MAPTRASRDPVYLAAAGLIALYIPAFIVPMVDIIRRSLRDGAGRYSDIVTDGFYISVALRTIAMATAVSAICALLAYPVARTMVRGPRWAAPLLSAVVVLPLLVSVVVRTFGWRVLLGATSPVVRFIHTHIDPDIRVLNNWPAIVIGMVHLHLPFMIFALYPALANVPHELEHAARNLGASATTVFRTIVFPLSVDGLIVGSSIVFALSASAFVTPALLGGGRIQVWSMLIYNRAMGAVDFDAAAVLGVLLALATLVIVLGAELVVRRAIRRRYGRRSTRRRALRAGAQGARL